MELKTIKDVWELNKRFIIKKARGQELVKCVLREPRAIHDIEELKDMGFEFLGDKMKAIECLEDGLYKNCVSCNLHYEVLK